MRCIIRGTVVGTETRDYKKRDGSEGRSLDVFIRQDGDDEGRYGATKVEAPLDLNVEPGQYVELDVNVRAVPYQGRAFETAYALGVRQVAPLREVKAS